MRVVAGSARGRKLASPKGTDTRPTSDRVRGAIFNILHSAGVLDGASVLDLFAGTGALGIEALSRGADHAMFVDPDARAVELVKANLGTTGLGAYATVKRADWRQFLAGSTREYDLALLDPPYAFDEWTDLLTNLPARIAVVESDRPIEPGNAWSVVRQKRYGTTVVGVLRREAPRPTP